MTRFSGFGPRMRASAWGMLAERVWTLTGTLYRRSALDLPRQLRLLGSASYPFYYTKTRDFAERFCARVRYNRYSKREEYLGVKNEPELLDALAPVLERRVEELEELPEQFVWWLDEAEKWRYAGGDDQGAMARARADLSELKAERTVELVKHTPALRDEPLVVFGWHRRFTHRVATDLGGLVIDGDTSAAKKEEVLASFRSGHVRTVVVNIKAGGVAVDLASARNALFGEVDWVAANMHQAEARIRGPKQLNRVTYWYVLCSDSVDEFVWRTMLGRGRDMRRLDDHLLSA